MRIISRVYVEWFVVDLMRPKGGRVELLIVVARYVHAMRENRFEALARNINCIMRR